MSLDFCLSFKFPLKVTSDLCLRKRENLPFLSCFISFSEEKVNGLNTLYEILLEKSLHTACMAGSVYNISGFLEKPLVKEIAWSASAENKHLYSVQSAEDEDFYYNWGKFLQKCNMGIHTENTR